MKSLQILNKVLVVSLLVSAMPGLAMQPNNEGQKTEDKKGVLDTLKNVAVRVFGPYSYEKDEAKRKAAVDALKQKPLEKNAGLKDKALFHAKELVVNPWSKLTIEHPNIATAAKYTGLVAAAAAVVGGVYGVYKYFFAKDEQADEVADDNVAVQGKKLADLNLIVKEARKAIELNKKGKLDGAHMTKFVTTNTAFKKACTALAKEDRVKFDLLAAQFGISCAIQDKQMRETQLNRIVKAIEVHVKACQEKANKKENK